MGDQEAGLQASSKITSWAFARRRHAVGVFHEKRQGDPDRQHGLTKGTGQSSKLLQTRQASCQKSRLAIFRRRTQPREASQRRLR